MMYVSRTLLSADKMVIYHLDYTSHCELNLLCIVICSSVVSRPHFPVSAKYSNQRANKNNLTVNVYSWEEKTE